MCDSIFRVDLDYVFVLKHHGSQKHVSEILSSAIQMSLKPHSRYCLDGVYRIICNYYLSPCGSALSPSAPRSICPDECSFVQNECFQDWITLEVMLRDHDFVHCEDTKALLFPLPSCCKEVGLVNISSKNGMFGNQWEYHSSMIFYCVLKCKLRVWSCSRRISCWDSAPS